MSGFTFWQHWESFGSDPMRLHGTCIGLALACMGLHMQVQARTGACICTCISLKSLHDFLAWYLHGICMVFAWELHAYASPMQVRRTASRYEGAADCVQMYEQKRVPTTVVACVAAAVVVVGPGFCRGATYRLRSPWCHSGLSVSSFTKTR